MTKENADDNFLFEKPVAPADKVPAWRLNTESVQKTKAVN